MRERGMQAELVLSGRKGELKNGGRAREDTPAKIRKLTGETDKKNKEHLEVLQEYNITEDEDKVKSGDLMKNAAGPSDSDEVTRFVSGLEKHFFMLKEKMSMFSSEFSVEQLLADTSHYCPALVFTSLQVPQYYTFSCWYCDQHACVD